MNSLHGSRVLVIGGGSGLGQGVAAAAKSRGATVLIAGRSKKRLAAARAALGDDVAALQADIADESGIREMAERAGAVDHVVVTAV